MQVSVDLSGIKRGLERLAANMPAFEEAVLADVGDGIETELKMRIRRHRVTPDGHVQQRNTARTLARKRRLGRGDTPLVDTGYMTRQRWRGPVRQRMVVLELPASRRGKVLEGLEAKGYDFWGIPVTINGKKTSDFIRFAMRANFKRLMRG